MNLKSIALAAALSLAAGASLAQPAPPPGPDAEGHAWRRPDPAQMAERRAQHLRDALQLRPDQEPALRALIAAMTPSPGEMDRMRDEREAAAKLTTPERLDRLQARMAEHEARFRTRAEAIKRFYAQLSPAQQKAFDALPMMMGRRMHEQGMGDHGHDGMDMKHDHHGMPGPGVPPPGR